MSPREDDIGVMACLAGNPVGVGGPRTYPNGRLCTPGVPWRGFGELLRFRYPRGIVIHTMAGRPAHYGRRALTLLPRFVYLMVRLSGKECVLNRHSFLSVL